jgi:hypothetical protein
MPTISPLVRAAISAPKDVAAAQALVAAARTGTVAEKADLAKQLALNSDKFSPEVRAILQPVLTMPTATAAGAANIGWTATTAPADLPLKNANVSGTLKYQEGFEGVAGGMLAFYVELPPGATVNGAKADRVNLVISGAQASDLQPLLGKAVSFTGDLDAQQVGLSTKRTVVSMKLDGAAVAKLVGHAVRPAFS